LIRNFVNGKLQMEGRGAMGALEVAEKNVELG